MNETIPPLLAAFHDHLPTDASWRLLEIGSGNGHHAVLIGHEFPTLQWVTSDVRLRHNAITKTLREAKLPNVHGPLVFEVGQDELPRQKFNAAYASHVLQHLPWKHAKSLIKMLGTRLREGSLVLFHGPFRYAGELASDRQRESEATLKARDPLLGIRAFEDVQRAMAKAGFALREDRLMTNENHLLVFVRLAHVTPDKAAKE